jgi:ABC-type sugar transport system ATPase subunit
MTTAAPIHLEAKDITKRFGATRALAGAHIALASGEVHALLGANGAGKSTLSRVISGHVQRDGGTVLLNGRPLELRSPRDAIEAGITMVMQETSLVPDMSVVENIFLPYLGRPGRLSFPAMRRRADAILADLGQTGAVSPDAEVRSLSVAQRQLVEIAKALALNSALIIFDEPTASLSPGEVERLFDVIVRLKQAGCALAFVSHRLEEVFALTDRVTVMREGRTVADSLDTASLNQAEIIRLMVGREIGQIFMSHPAAKADRPVALDVSHLSSLPAVRDVSFQLHRGEVLGLAGLIGAGRSETVEAIFGLRARSGGTLRLAGKLYDPRSPAAAIRAGVGLVAEDRRGQSIVPDFSVRENLLLGHLGAHRGFGLAYGSRQAKIEALMAQLEVPIGRLQDASLLDFSGGMQQKIIIARWLLLEPQVLMLDEPTKGVDIGTRASIYAILRDIAARGVAVLVVSSDFQELLGLCERVIVMSDGATTADMPSALLDEEKLTLFAAPRSSMEANQALLRDLASTYGGSAFWAIVDRDRVFCLNAVVGDGRADPGLTPGGTPRFDETRIPLALTARSEGFVADASRGLSTLIVEVRTPRGHDMGAIGLVLPADGALPSAAAIRDRVANLAQNAA